MVTLLSFPCDFPIKVLGLNDPAFRMAVLAICQRHIGGFEATNVTERLSQHDKYLSLTYVFTAQSQSQIDNLYRELTAHPLVKMAL